MNIDFIRKNHIFWSRLGFCYDPPLKDENGEPVLISQNMTRDSNFHKTFSKHGIKLHSCILHSGWVGVNEYDYSLTDKVLDEIFSDEEDIMYIPRVKLNVPVDWCRENPEDVFVYPEGPRTAEDISTLAGTLKHDYLGYESPGGYYQANGDFVDKRPNVGGVISMQSLSSKKWKTDAGIALKKLIEHIENSKYGSRILGYHIAFGPCGETMEWGRDSKHYGDYGINQLRNFYDFGIKKYGSKEAIGRKWQQNDITRDTVILPMPDERYNNLSTLKDLFRGDDKDTISIDYDEFLSDSVTDAVEYFGKIVKDNTNNKPVGVFYGYFLFVDNAAYAGHLAMDKLLDSPYVDFFAAPMPYYKRLSGEPSGDMCVAQSVNRKKLWIEEIDNRTHLTNVAGNKEDGLTCKTDKETKYVMWRNTCKNIVSQSGQWWMDLGGGWYDSDFLLNEVQQIRAKTFHLVEKEHISKSDVLIVVDEKCIYKTKVCYDILKGFLMDFICETRKSSTMVDVYRLSDLESMNLEQYKLIIFAYDFMLDSDVLEKLNIPKHCTVMFNYAAGIWNNKFSLHNTEKLTGFELEEYNCSDYNFPMLKFRDSNETIMEHTVNGRNIILNLQPLLQADKLQQIAKNAGCKVYTDCNCIIYGDNRFISFFSCKKMNESIHFNEKLKLRNIISDEIYECDTLPISLNNSEFVIFEIME